jgi:hypothetical protein
MRYPRLGYSRAACGKFGPLGEVTMAITPFEAAKLLAEFKINLNAGDFARRLEQFGLRYKAAEHAQPPPPPPKPKPKPKPKPAPEAEEFAQLYDAMTKLQRRLKAMSPGLKRKLDDEAESGAGWTKELISYIDQAQLLFSQVTLEEEEEQEPEPPPKPAPPPAKREKKTDVEQEVLGWLMGVWKSGTGQKPSVTFTGGAWKSPFYTFASQCYRYMGIPSEGLGNLIKRLT